MIIDDKDFIGREFPQSCGDSLLVLEKIPSKGKGKPATFKCRFTKYKDIEVISQKHHIIKGEIYNKQVADLENFIGKTFKQNCGNTLVVLGVEGNRYVEKENKYVCLYKCQFFNTNTIIIDRKDSILKGLVDDRNFINYKKYPYKSREKLISIIESFSEKPSLDDLAIKLNIAVSTIGQAINKFNLRHLIYWNFGKEEEEVRIYCKSIDNSFLDSATF